MYGDFWRALGWTSVVCQAQHNRAATTRMTSGHPIGTIDAHAAGGRSSDAAAAGVSVVRQARHTSNERLLSGLASQHLTRRELRCADVPERPVAARGRRC